MTDKGLNPQRGEIWYVKFDPTIGSEIQKTRPAVVVNEDWIGRLPLRIVVPITDWNSDYEALPWIIRLPVTPQNGLEKISGVDTFQVKSVSVERFENIIGTVKASELTEIAAGIALCVGYE